MALDTDSLMFAPPLSALPCGSHLCDGFLDGLFLHPMSDESLTELFDGTVLGALRFPLGQVLGELVGDVGPDKRLPHHRLTSL